MICPQQIPKEMGIIFARNCRIVLLSESELFTKLFNTKVS